MRRRELNGIPSNLVKSYFGTMRYYDCGYMADWLFYAAKKLAVKEAVLDINEGTITPKELQLRPLMYHMPSLKDIIRKELVNNGFPEDYFKTAVIRIIFPDDSYQSKYFYCSSILTSKEGDETKAENIIEYAYEKEFDPFKRSNIFLGFLDWGRGYLRDKINS